MLLTRECDYAVRIIRALSNGEITNVQEISDVEKISVQITYKLARKLEKSGMIQSFRGVKGGYALKKKLDQITLYDIFTAVDQKLLITQCTDCSYLCSQNTKDSPCLVHREFCRLQEIITNELKAKSLLDIME